MKISEPCIGAIRGRNPDNPTSRKSGEPTSQMLEIKTDGTANTLTTVQKDNVVVEPSKYIRYTEDGFHLARNDKKRSSIQGTHVTYDFGNAHCLGTSHVPMTVVVEPMIIDPQGRLDKICTPQELCPTLRAQIHGNPPQAIEPMGRIRKLTPLECYRLMGFSDTDFYKAQKAINETYHNGRDRANSQLYKQAGNSIVVNVLEAIFKEMME